MKLGQPTQLEDSKGPSPLVFALESACYAVVRNHDKAPVSFPDRESAAVGLASFAVWKVTDSNCNTWKPLQVIDAAMDRQGLSDVRNPPLLDVVELSWIEDLRVEVFSLCRFVNGIKPQRRQDLVGPWNDV